MDAQGNSTDNTIQAENANQEKRVSLPHSDVDSLQLLSRLFLGLAMLGSDELIQRLRDFQMELEAKPELLPPSRGLDEENGQDLLRYLAIGLLLRGQKRTVQGIQRGIEFSFRTASRLYETFSTLTDNPLMRPMRRSVDALVENMQNESKLLVREGRLEEQSSRWLAGQTVGEVIDEFIDYISENPELADLIREQIGQQSIGLAGVVVENSRRITHGADYALEGVIRRILRLKSREELPKSSLAGKPQLMYLPYEPDTPETDE